MNEIVTFYSRVHRARVLNHKVMLLYCHYGYDTIIIFRTHRLFAEIKPDNQLIDGQNYKWYAFKLVQQGQIGKVAFVNVSFYVMSNYIDLCKKFEHYQQTYTKLVDYLSVPKNFWYL